MSGSPEMERLQKWRERHFENPKGKLIDWRPSIKRWNGEQAELESRNRPDWLSGWNIARAKAKRTRSSQRGRERSEVDTEKGFRSIQMRHFMVMRDFFHLNRFLIPPALPASLSSHCDVSSRTSLRPLRQETCADSARLELGWHQMQRKAK